MWRPVFGILALAVVVRYGLILVVEAMGRPGDLGRVDGAKPVIVGHARDGIERVQRSLLF